MICRKHGIVYICNYCQAHHEQPFGRVVEKTSAKGLVMDSYKFATGPPSSRRCEECGSNFSVGLYGQLTFKS